MGVRTEEPVLKSYLEITTSGSRDRVWGRALPLRKSPKKLQTFSAQRQTAVCYNTDVWASLLEILIR